MVEYLWNLLDHRKENFSVRVYIVSYIVYLNLAGNICTEGRRFVMASWEMVQLYLFFLERKL